MLQQVHLKRTFFVLSLMLLHASGAATAAEDASTQPAHIESTIESTQKPTAPAPPTGISPGESNPKLESDISSQETRLKHIRNDIQQAKSQLADITTELEKASETRNKMERAKDDLTEQSRFLGHVIDTLHEYEMDVQSIAAASGENLKLEYSAKDKKLTITGRPDLKMARKPFDELMKLIAELERMDVAVAEFEFSPSPEQVITLDKRKLVIKKRSK